MYSTDIRKLALHIYSVFHSLRKTGVLVQASHTSVARWLKNPVPKGYSSVRRLTTRTLVVEALRGAILSNPLLTLAQLRSIVLQTTGVSTSRELLRIALKNCNITSKKARFYGMSPKVPERTQEFVAQRSNFILQGRPFFSVDEAGFGRHRHPVRGYAPKGQPILLRKKCTRESNVSVIACVSFDRLELLKESKKPITSPLFAEFMEALKAPRGSVILLDNASIHKSKELQVLAEARGWVLLFTPPYSPWFNPIEGVFSVVKRHYYKHGDILAAFQAVQPSHCSAFFNHSQKIEKDIKTN